MNGLFIEDDSALRSLEPGETFACMFSGGKDCGLALHMAEQMGKCVALLHCAQENDKDIYHGQSDVIVRHQAKAMRLPLRVLRLDPQLQGDLLIQAFKEVKKELGISAIVYGDIHVNKNAVCNQINCYKAGLRLCMPLWHRSNEELLALTGQFGVQSVVVSVNTDYLPEAILGQRFHGHIAQKKLGQAVDPFGENGEFHTILVNGQLFQKPLVYEIKALLHQKQIAYLDIRTS